MNGRFLAAHGARRQWMVGETRGARRRAVAVGLIGASVLGLAAAWPALAANPPPSPRPLDRDLDRYVLFALDSLTFKGADGGPAQGGIVVGGGDIGVNNVGGTLNMCGGGGRHSVRLQNPFAQVAADFATLGTSCDLNDVWVGSNATHLRGSPRMASLSFFTPPIIPADELPKIPDDHCGGPSVVAAPSHLARVDQPGRYGTLKVANNSFAVIGGTVGTTVGRYVFCSVSVGKNAIVVIDPRVEIWVQGAAQFGNGSTIGPDNSVDVCIFNPGFPIERGPCLPAGQVTAGAACAVPWWIKGEGVKASQPVVGIGKLTTVYGRFWGLNGSMALGTAASLNGRFWAKSFSSDFHVRVGACPEVPPPPPPSTTTTPTTGTTSFTPPTGSPATGVTPPPS